MLGIRSFVCLFFQWQRICSLKEKVCFFCALISYLKDLITYLHFSVRETGPGSGCQDTSISTAEYVDTTATRPCRASGFQATGILTTDGGKFKAPSDWSSTSSALTHRCESAASTSLNPFSPIPLNSSLSDTWIPPKGRWCGLEQSIETTIILQLNILSKHLIMQRNCLQYMWVCKPWCTITLGCRWLLLIGTIYLKKTFKDVFLSYDRKIFCRRDYGSDVCFISKSKTILGVCCDIRKPQSVCVCVVSRVSQEPL